MSSQVEKRETERRGVKTIKSWSVKTTAITVVVVSQIEIRLCRLVSVLTLLFVLSFECLGSLLTSRMSSSQPYKCRGVEIRRLPVIAGDEFFRLRIVIAYVPKHARGAFCCSTPNNHYCPDTIPQTIPPRTWSKSVSPSSTTRRDADTFPPP